MDTGTSIKSTVINAADIQAKVSNIGAENVWDSIKSANVPGTMNMHYVFTVKGVDVVVNLKLYRHSQYIRQFTVQSLPDVIRPMAPGWRDTLSPAADSLPADNVPDVADLPPAELQDVTGQQIGQDKDGGATDSLPADHVPDVTDEPQASCCE